MDNLKRLGLVGVLGATAGLGGCGAMMQEVAYRHPDPLVGQNLGVLGRLVSALDDDVKHSETRRQPVRDEINTIQDSNAARITRIWENYNVQHNGKNGLGIYTDFTAHVPEGTILQETAYFFDGQGNPLKDLDGIYSTQEGQAAVSGARVSIGHGGNEKREGYFVFMPFSQFEIEDAQKHAFSYRVVVWNRSTKEKIQETTLRTFTLRKIGN